MNQHNDDYSVARDTFTTLRPLLLVAVLVVGWIGVEIWTWVFENGAPSNPEIRSAMVRNFALIGLGLIGLPLAVWRTYTAHRQANETIQQGRRTEKQLSLTSAQLKITADSNNAELLEKGAELLSNDDLRKRETAVSFLIAIAEDNDNKYAISARNLLKSAVENITIEYTRPNYAVITLEYFQNYFSSTNISEYVGPVVVKNALFSVKIYPSILGITYTGGVYYKRVFEEGFIGIFDDCKFMQSTINTLISVKNNVKFENSRIKTLPSMNFEGGGNISFENCDFSDCSILGFADVPKGFEITEGYFLETAPPSEYLLNEYGRSLIPLTGADYESRRTEYPR